MQLLQIEEYLATPQHWEMVAGHSYTEIGLTIFILI